MRISEALTLILLAEVACVWVVDRSRPQPPAPPDRVLPYLAPSIVSIIPSPNPITMTSSDPDTGVTGSATVTSTINGAAKSKAWTLAVNATSSTLTNCSSISVSAVQVSCSGVTTGGTGAAKPTGTCGAAATLGTTPVTIASGIQGDQSDIYTIQLNYQFTDDWRYKGANSPACTLTLTYTLTLAT